MNANCAGSSSAYSAAQFTTSAPFTCNAPTGLTASTITSSSAVISWSAVNGALSYNLEYKTTATNTWTTAASGLTTTTYTLSGLGSSTAYDWRVMSNCNGSNSTYAASQFTTSAAQTCPGIYDISTNNTSAGAATVPFNSAIYGLISASNDVDYYKFTITTGGTATITLTTLPANYDLYLYSGNGTTQLASSRKSGTQAETISRTYTPGNYFLRVIGKNGAFNANNCYTLNIQLGTATTQELLIPMNNENTVAKLYPNPARDILNVSTAQELDASSELTVYDLRGQVRLRHRFEINPQSLDLSQLSTGIYYLRVKTAEGEDVYKFVKD